MNESTRQRAPETFASYLIQRRYGDKLVSRVEMLLRVLVFCILFAFSFPISHFPFLNSYALLMPMCMPSIQTYAATQA